LTIAREDKAKERTKHVRRIIEQAKRTCRDKGDPVPQLLVELIETISILND